MVCIALYDLHKKEFWICEMNDQIKRTKNSKIVLQQNVFMIIFGFHDYLWFAYATTIDSVLCSRRYYIRKNKNTCLGI